MSGAPRPLMEFDRTGTAPVLSYDVPQPSRYTGRNFIELEFDDEVWSEAAHTPPERDTTPPGSGGGSSGGTGGLTLEDLVRFEELDPIAIEAVLGGLSPPGGAGPDPGPLVNPATDATTTSLPALDESIADLAAGRRVLAEDDRETLHAVLSDETFLREMAREEPESFVTMVGMLSAVSGTATDERPVETTAAALTVSGTDSGSYDTPLGRLVDRVGEEALVTHVADGGRLRETRTFSGKKELHLAKSLGASGVRPRLAVVETYALSSYLGDYGAGRTVKTFSLLPGERTTISVRTFKSSERSQSEASSVLDSYEEETADEFGSDIKSENSVREEDTSNFSYHAEARAEAGWGWGSAEVSGGVAGGSTSAREEFGKNVASATEKHAAKAASKRSVEVNTSSEFTETTEEETAITREIENVNVSRTLNFVFRQINQEFISLLHLLDARVAFHNGDQSSYREVTLSELDALLAEMILSEHREAVRAAIVESLSHVFDYRGEHHSFVEERGIVDGEGDPITGPGGDPLSYLRAAPGRQIYEPNGITVDGVILTATKTTLPTDGIVVEALLGQGEALDGYSTGIQAEEVEARELENETARAAVRREQLAHDVVKDGDDAAADRYAIVYATDHDDESDDPTPEPVTPSDD